MHSESNFLDIYMLVLCYELICDLETFVLEVSRLLIMSAS